MYHAYDDQWWIGIVDDISLTNFTIAGNQLLATTLLYYKLNLRPIHVKSTLC